MATLVNPVGTNSAGAGSDSVCAMSSSTARSPANADAGIVTVSVRDVALAWNDTDVTRPREMAVIPPMPGRMATLRHRVHERCKDAVGRQHLIEQQVLGVRCRGQDRGRAARKLPIGVVGQRVGAARTGLHNADHT